MNVKLVLLPNLSIIVSDEEIKQGDYFIDLYRESYRKPYLCDIGSANVFVLTKEINFPIQCCKKIIAGHLTLPEIDYSLLSINEQKKLGIFNVEKEVKTLLNVPNKHLDNEDWDKINFGVDCFNLAQVLNNKKLGTEAAELLLIQLSEFIMTPKMRNLYDLDYKQWVIRRDKFIYNTINTIINIKIYNIEIEMNNLTNIDILSGINNAEPIINNNKIKITKLCLL